MPHDFVNGALFEKYCIFGGCMTKEKTEIMRSFKTSMENLHKESFRCSFLESIFVSPKSGSVYGGIHPLNGGGHFRSISRAYLSYLIKRLFNLHRLPGCEEQINELDEDCIKRLLTHLSDKKTDDHLRELERLYKFTQQTLKSIFGDFIPILRRGLKHEEAMIAACIARYSESEDLPDIKIHANTFDFYAFYPAGGFDHGVSIIREVPLQDILICHQTVQGFHYIDSDVFVINRDEKGILPLTIDNLNIDSVFQLDEHDYERFKKHVDRSPEIIGEFFEGLYRELSYQSYPRSIRFNHGKWTMYFERLGRKVGRIFDSKYEHTFERY
jgi:predicted GNAT family N-acyltransferase